MQFFAKRIRDFRGYKVLRLIAILKGSLSTARKASIKELRVLP